ncbi:MAG: nicotinate phosphoribosyltransferase [Synergistaceae bacterium]
MNLIDKPIITSMLDDDMYKFCMQQAFMELFPNAIGSYRFNNRGNHRFNQDFVDSLNYQIQECMPALKVTDAEIEWFSSVSPFLKPWYLEALRNFRYDPNGVEVRLSEDNNLIWETKGLVREKMMWEVKMMATISELYFKLIDTDWNMNGQEDLARGKANDLSENNCFFIDFGTRRRRSYHTQDMVVRNMRDFSPENVKPNFKGGFTGTSNVHLSHKYGLIPKGTQAHEFFQAMQALEGVRNSNYYAMNNWVRVYNGSLGIALPDTLGTEQFLKNFGLRYAKLFDGVRWDSGDPYWFTDIMLNHYRGLGIDPLSKTIIYSNALDVKKAIEIRKYCEGKIKSSFGIGTFFTNDFNKTSSPAEVSKALNMVIKLWSVNDIPVVKLSDDKGKEMGDSDAVRVAKWMVYGKPLG